MSITVGPGIEADAASTHLSNLRRRLAEGEELQYLGAAHPHIGFDLYAVTNTRVLGVASRRGYAIKAEFPTADVTSAYVREDPEGHAVHVPLEDDGHWILRPHNSAEGAANLARAVHAAAAATHDGAREGVLMPEDRGEPTMLEEAGFDYLQIVVSRDDIEAGDITRTLSTLAPLLQSRRTARTFLESVTIAFDGYNDTREELFEIPEVRDFVQALDQRFPYWLYFLDKSTGSFDAIWRCFMPPYLTDKARAEQFPRHLDPLLRNWWAPAMDAICDFVGMNETEHKNLCERYSLYFQGKRDF